MRHELAGYDLAVGTGMMDLEPLVGKSHVPPLIRLFGPECSSLDGVNSILLGICSPAQLEGICLTRLLPNLDNVLVLLPVKVLVIVESCDA